MTELTPYRPTQVEVYDPRDAAVKRLTEWATSAQAAHQVAQSLVQTSFVPDGFRGKAHEATAAILAGLEVGLSPMAALRSFDVIQGQAAPRAITLRAIVQSHGHEMVIEESTATRCRMRGRRRDTTEWQTVAWTIDRAKQLGLTNKANWKNQPQAMLVARATSELARLIAADAILGIAYAAEEIEDGGTEVGVTAATEPTGRKMSRKRAAEPTSEPVSDVPAEPVVYEASGMDEFTPPEPITAPQMKKLHALLNEKGYGDRDAGLAYLSSVVGRDVDTSKSLSRDEARRVIDALESPAPVDEPDPEVEALWNGGQS